ncbi:uncharacterized protein EI90DRAFT_3051676 [Cantharellus anzutake]|uniref:uncharacterized protein n=1 Tax=Cantharellus anzutake TaxID=1750568 RepID=UPI001905FB9E|nr:uncharacterized protein EI90DRAFT_3051676 [Cantharellus anzutake]KAF8334273.1 hypothetical protein EI90DRAFT_3051676 [Cantharellus anzutake]
MMVTIVSVLTVAGPDYIAPRAHGTGSTSKRFYNDSMMCTNASAPSTSRRDDLIISQPPDYTIQKAWWTAGGRSGMMAFSLIPVCVCIALKAPPFAILAIPFTIQLHSDRLMWIHRWIGRFIYLLTVAHVVTWTIQLCKDRRHGSFGTIALGYTYLYDKFIYGVVAFVCMTFLVMLSSAPLRRDHYETFYFIHVLTVPSTLAFSALHYPPLGWFCWSALLLWIMERVWRGIRFFYTNGVFVKRPPADAAFVPSSESRDLPEEFDPADIDMDAASISLSVHDTTSSITRLLIRHTRNRSVDSSGSYISHIPPGYARAELLPGRMIRLIVHTPRPMSWVAGQYALLKIPDVSSWTTHPFTMASMCHSGKGCIGDDAESLMSAGGPHEIVFLIRARQGFTLDLWHHVRKLTAQPNSTSYRVHERPSSGMISVPSQKWAPLIRAQVDGPFGSAARAMWTTYSTVVIVAGGSGVAFALSVLEYLCHALSRKGGGDMNDCSVTRVRFLWVVSEYSHLLWCATTLRRCLQLAPQGSVQLDLFVTNYTHHILGSTPHYLSQSEVFSAAPDELAPPTIPFGSRGDSSPSDSDTESGLSDTESIVDLHYAADSEDEREGAHRRSLSHTQSQYTSIYGDAQGEHCADLTNFAGEDRSRAPGEDQFSMSVKKKGKHMRRKTLAGFVKLRLNTKRNPSPPANELFAITQLHPGIPLTPLTVPSSVNSEGIHPPITRAVSPTSVAGPRSTSPAPRPSSRPGHLSPIDKQSHQPTRSYSPLRAQPYPASDFGGQPSPRDDAPSPGDRSTMHAHLLPHTLGDDSDHIFDLSPTDRSDLEFTAALARRGRPRLDRILAEEVNRAAGTLAVASCGPHSLTAVVRKVVAAQIHPALVWKGDERGYINFFSEEFAF